MTHRATDVCVCVRAYLTEPVWPARLRYQSCGLARSESPGSDGHWFACTAELGWCLSSTPNTHNNILLDLFHSKIIQAKEFKAKHEELLLYKKIIKHEVV